MINFDETKIKLAKEILDTNTYRYRNIFNLFANEINIFLNEYHLTYKQIFYLLQKKLGGKIKYRTFMNWIKDNKENLQQTSKISKEIPQSKPKKPINPINPVEILKRDIFVTDNKYKDLI